MTTEERITSLESRVHILEAIIAAYENGFVSNLKYQQTTIALRSDNSEFKTDISDLKTRVASLESAV